MVIKNRIGRKCVGWQNKKVGTVRFEREKTKRDHNVTPLNVIISLVVNYFLATFFFVAFLATFLVAFFAAFLAMMSSVIVFHRER